MRSDSTHVRTGFEQAMKSIPSAQAVIITTMPRGSLQIAQPARVPESLLRAYSREQHLNDRLTWHVMSENRAARARDVVGEDHPFIRDYLGSNGLAFAIAAPLRSPVIEGYPGAIHLYRTVDQGAFSAEDVRKLRDIADQISETSDASRPQSASPQDEKVTLTPRPNVRVFAFNKSGKQLLWEDEFAKFDSRLRQEMAHQAQAWLGRMNGELVMADRVQLPDSRGDLWTFRLVSYAKYPALGDDSVALFCVQPSCAEWAAVRPTDLQADPELARLVPAMKFMRQEYHRGPTLGEIAKQVHLSPFHFHRRFTELLGLTPKHYLLECQINAAKQELISGKKELTQIATDCGFAHQSHFTSRFKQATGLTPTRWRRQAQEAQRN